MKIKILDEMSELAGSRSAGVWKAHARSNDEIEIRVNEGTTFRSTSYGLMRNDAQFIAMCANKIDALIECARALERTIPDLDPMFASTKIAREALAKLRGVDEN